MFCILKPQPSGAREVSEREERNIADWNAARKGFWEWATILQMDLSTMPWEWLDDKQMVSSSKISALLRSS